MNIPENLDGFGDRQQLQTVLTHLLENSLTFSPEENGPITVSAREDSWNDTNGICIEVRDLGPGIDPATREKIFQPFFSTRESGTGLGLAIIRQIVENHHGEVAVISNPGQGCTMQIFLPLPSHIA